MIAQILLSLLLCGVLVYAWAEYRRSPVVALMSFVVSLAGLYFVWVPGHSTRLAEFAGVGRGVDLILYTWVGISLIVLLNLHLKLRAQLELITVLARTIALAKIGSRPTEESRAAGSPSVPLLNKALLNEAMTSAPEPRLGEVDERRSRRTPGRSA
jgi:small membrane protein